MRDNDLTDFIDGVTSAATSAEVWQSATRFFAGMGFDKVCYGTKPAAQGGATSIRMTGDLAAWQAAYRAEGDAAHDPLFAHTAFLPSTFFTGHSFTADYPYLTRSERAVITRAADFGYTCGAAMVMPHACKTTTGGWHFVSDRPKSQFLPAFEHHRPMLEIATAFAHRESERRAGPPASAMRLTPREAECLKWLGMGLRTEQIADRLGIRPVTVDLHIRSARTRLGARTREQALAIALSEGLIEL